MKRRVLVAQALVHRPPVIVLDEPTAGVDVELRQTLWKFISRLNKEGHTIILTTHYLEEAEALCDRIAMLKFGRGGGAGPHQQPADPVRGAATGAHAVARHAAAGAGGAAHAVQPGRARPPAAAVRLRSRRTDPGRAAARLAAKWKTWKSARPTSKTCSSRSCAEKVTCRARCLMRRWRPRHEPNPSSIWTIAPRRRPT